MTLGARVLAEFGDDPNRYVDAKCRKNYSGMSPITRASGKHHVVLARYARNRRLADACYQWAFATLTASPGARTFYDQRRAAGDTTGPRTKPRSTDRALATGWSEGVSVSGGRWCVSSVPERVEVRGRVPVGCRACGGRVRPRRSASRLFS